MSRIGVLGAGTWGTALAIMLAQNAHSVTLWSALDNELNALETTHTHPNLKGSVIPESMAFTNDISEVCSDKDVLLFAVASPYVRETAKKASPYIKEGQIIVDAAKGLEEDTLFTMSQVIKDGVGKEVTVVALSGPTHAEEVALGLPTTVVAACQNLNAAEQVQTIFMNTCMRVYTNEDILGVELCGALKNIIALACGISTGLGFGDNAKAAIITRGIAEMSRLGMAMNCDKMTFAGLAGLGDLIVTATSRHSRNNRAGFLIGSGCSADDAIKKVGMVVEGIHAIPPALKLAEKYKVDMPIITAVHKTISGELTPDEAVSLLMNREKKSEK
ncbi:MAG: NAD(P)-dependent glycerol-3-phosphate dehydrogenase [Eubacterium sp.]|nr:NAD(P)-dependent glycerol-3-phosphate dehydrogenase [Eubacterium sp.]